MDSIRHDKNTLRFCIVKHEQNTIENIFKKIL